MTRGTARTARTGRGGALVVVGVLLGGALLSGCGTAEADDSAAQEAVHLIEQVQSARADALTTSDGSAADQRRVVEELEKSPVEFTPEEAERERRVRQRLSSPGYLRDGGHRIELDRGHAEIDLVEATQPSEDRLEVTVREQDTFPYTGEPMDQAWGETYERRVVLVREGGRWLVAENHAVEEADHVPATLDGAR